jgi:hypothetical protein
MELNRKTLDHFSKGSGAYSAGYRSDVGWSMNTGHNGQGHDEDLRWLL